MGNPALAKKRENRRREKQNRFSMPSTIVSRDDLTQPNQAKPKRQRKRKGQRNGSQH
jgi:hypothetical protein